VKVFLSSDMEGTAGIVDWEQCIGPGPEYEMGRRLLLDEVNAAIDGALAAGANEVLVNDSHSVMRNLPPASLHGRAGYLSGRHKPMYMMEGLDSSFDAVLFVSYHGSAGTSSVLSHTYNPASIAGVRLNGTVTGEAGINALVALQHRVPVVLITGDDVTAVEAAPFLPGVECVVVKESVTRHAARSLHPEEACERIRDGALRALGRAAQVPLPSIELPARLEVDWVTADMAELACELLGVERTGDRTVTMTAEDPLRLYRTFVVSVALTRSLVEGR